MLSVTVFVVTSIAVKLPVALVTKTCEQSELIATATGTAPTVIVPVTEFVAVSTTDTVSTNDTVPDPKLVT